MKTQNYSSHGLRLGHHSSGRPFNKLQYHARYTIACCNLDTALTHSALTLCLTAFGAIIQAFPKIVFENGRTKCFKATYCEKVVQLFFYTPLLYVSLVGFVAIRASLLIFIAILLTFIASFILVQCVLSHIVINIHSLSSASNSKSNLVHKPSLGLILSPSLSPILDCYLQYATLIAHTHTHTHTLCNAVALV